MPEKWIVCTNSCCTNNDPKHKAYVVREWLLYNRPGLHDKNKNVLKAKLKLEWDFVDINYIKKLIESMPKRIVGRSDRAAYYSTKRLFHKILKSEFTVKYFTVINSYNFFVRSEKHIFCYRLLFLFVNNKYCYFFVFLY